MNIKLTKDMAAYVDALVQTGQYRSVGDVIDDALNLLAQKQDKDALAERLRMSMSMSIKQATSGTGTVVDDAFFDRLRQKIAAAGF